MQRRLAVSLLLLRLGVFIVFLMWTLDKFVNPGHAGRVFAVFYGLEGVGETALWVIGALQLILILLFVAGCFKTWTYAAVTVFHGVSTLSSYGQYLEPFENLLFFAAWPMLSACVALFLLRDYDTLTAGRGLRGDSGA